ncbi:MAG: hypothetical protein Q3971_04680 [Moraxella sp.]|nr:hypothetical protein [Moraxella sp.]
MNAYLIKITSTLLVLVLPVMAQANRIDSSAVFNQNTKGYPIKAVIDQWGQPTNVQGRWYHWQECYNTDVVTSQYSGGGSWTSFRDQVCCVQKFKVKQGMIQKYDYGAFLNTASGKRNRSPVGSYCFHHLDYSKIHQNYRRVG